MDRSRLISYLDDYLQINAIADYGPQGLQVEANPADVKRIATAVDTSPDTIKAAAAWQADMLLVHHGIFWRTVEPIRGPLGARVRLLLSSNINLYAAHLALDAHPEVGNNAVLAKMFGLDVTDWWFEAGGVKIGVLGDMKTNINALLQNVNTQLHTQARLLAHGPQEVRRLAIVSGFGADRVAEVKRLGADTFLTGETSHANYWAASDYGINVIFAGHYATETVGVQALGQHLTTKFNLETKFFDFPTAM